ncbi:MAG TPA: hypothetical protein PL155_01275 [Candidatus Omnitrophota bacterium]|nr:hypothetical protein [Candidatus Omnitrophota bacterium]HPD84882.1 hypothetical protein [Candidatus Omnitrophota bacterium]HRZ03740.1 hypothetical protein [Candidatus Omnitrophota bacterium]
MNTLDELLAIPDKTERHKALVDLARSFNINIAQVKEPNGEIREEELAVLIFEAQEKKKKKQFQNIAVVVVGIFFVIITLIFMGTLSKLLSGLKGGFGAGTETSPEE